MGMPSFRGEMKKCLFRAELMANGISSPGIQKVNNGLTAALRCYQERHHPLIDQATRPIRSPKIPSVVPLVAFILVVHVGAAV
ncbi:hypothetical protein BDV12DRAFT_175550 [Aspergillus spectabilis]